MAKLYVSNKDETARLFKNDIFEMLSKVHWTVPLYFYIPIISYFFYLTIAKFQISFFDTLIYCVFGLFIWSLTEYSLHRFVFHYEPRSDWGKRLHFLFHGVHHDYPNDSKRLVMPPSISLPLATGFYFLFKYFLGFVFISPFFAGFLLGYLFYDISHYAVHHFNMKSKFWLAIKNHHMLHHYKHPDLGYGVSQPLWDHIFKTTYPKKNVAEQENL